jgi:hypothetical protein
MFSSKFLSLWEAVKSRASHPLKGLARPRPALWLVDRSDYKSLLFNQAGSSLQRAAKAQNGQTPPPDWKYGDTVE